MDSLRREPDMSAEHNALPAVASNLPQSEPVDQPSSPPIWVQRLQLIVFVVFCVELGMLLAVLPWTRVWTENSLVLSHPGLRAVLQHNFVRGAVTGLGLVDIWLGIWEAVHYRERSARR